MPWERPFLAVAALYDGAWMVVLLAAPESVFARHPPYERALAASVGAVGACFAVGADRRTPRLLASGLLAKGLGPVIFGAAVSLGYLSPAQWPLTLANDVVSIAPLAVLVRRGGPS